MACSPCWTPIFWYVSLAGSHFACLPAVLYKTRCVQLKYIFPVVNFYFISFSCSFDWKCYVTITVNCLTWHEESDSIHRFLCCDTKIDGNQWNRFVLSLHAPQNGSRECLTVTAFSSECASLQNVRAQPYSTCCILYTKSTQYGCIIIAYSNIFRNNKKKYTVLIASRLVSYTSGSQRHNRLDKNQQKKHTHTHISLRRLVFLRSVPSCFRWRWGHFIIELQMRNVII